MIRGRLERARGDQHRCRECAVPCGIQPQSRNSMRFPFGAALVYSADGRCVDKQYAWQNAAPQPPAALAATPRQEDQAHTQRRGHGPRPAERAFVSTTLLQQAHLSGLVPKLSGIQFEATVVRRSHAYTIVIDGRTQMGRRNGSDITFDSWNTSRDGVGWPYSVHLPQQRSRARCAIPRHDPAPLVQSRQRPRSVGAHDEHAAPHLRPAPDCTCTAEM